MTFFFYSICRHNIIIPRVTCLHCHVKSQLETNEDVSRTVHYASTSRQRSAQVYYCYIYILHCNSRQLNRFCFITVEKIELVTEHAEFWFQTVQTIKNFIERLWRIKKKIKKVTSSNQFLEYHHSRMNSSSRVLRSFLPHAVRIIPRYLRYRVDERVEKVFDG